jgi:ribosomal protein L37E
MRYCPHCGKTYSPKTDVCPSCGRHLDKDTTIKCPVCGTIISDYSFPYCSHCGSKVEVPGLVNLNPYARRVQGHPWVCHLCSLVISFALIFVIHFPLIGTVSPFDYLKGNNLIANASIVSIFTKYSSFASSIQVNDSFYPFTCVVGLLALFIGIMALVSIGLSIVDLSGRRNVENSKKIRELLIINSIEIVLIWALYASSLYGRNTYLAGAGFSAYPLLFAIVASIFYLPLPFLKAFVFKKKNDIA